MALVIAIPKDSKLVMKFVTGTNPLSFAPIVKSKTFSKIKAGALDQDVYDVGTSLVGLQKYPLDSMYIINNFLNLYKRR